VRIEEFFNVMECHACQSTLGQLQIVTSRSQNFYIYVFVMKVYKIDILYISVYTHSAFHYLIF
jgi:hypothetical protein